MNFTIFSSDKTLILLGTFLHKIHYFGILVFFNIYIEKETLNAVKF